MKYKMAVTLYFALLVLLSQAAAAGNAPKPAFALERQEVLTHYQSVDVANLDEAREEIAYLRSISRPKQALINNLADDLQLRFTLRNLKKAGKTPQNAPQLFATIARQRFLHKQTAPAALVDPPATDQRMPVNAITDLGQVSTTPNYSTTGLSTIPGGTLSTLAVIQLFDASTNTPFGPGASNTQFGGGENLTVTQTSAPPATISHLGGILQVTYQANTTSDPVTVTYQLTEDSAAPLAPPNVTAPKIVKVTVPPKTKIKVCLSRNTTSDPDCDYGPYQSPTPNPIVQLPVSGDIAFDANVDTTRAISGTLIVWGQGGGGACTLSLGKTNFAPAFVPSGAKLTWLFSHVDGVVTIDTASFGVLGNNPCWQPGQDYGMELDVSVPVVGNLLPQQFFVTTIPGVSLPNTTRIPTLVFTFGCFAAGSRVLMADGSVKAIEEVKAGDIVIADASGRKLTVRQTMEGLEARPMVIITDARGHTLSITEGHAVVVRDGSKRKVVLAKELKEGDVVFTSDLALDDGKPRRFAASKIVKIERKKYDGHVYNVYLGVKGEAFDSGNTTLIADGILTGDNAMQELYGADFHFKPKNVRDRLPREWHADYDNFIKNQRPH